MFNYSNQTEQLWDGRANTIGGSGSDTRAVPPVRPPMPSFQPAETTVSSVDSEKESSESYFQALEVGQHMPGYDKMKRAAFAAGYASKSASRRGSMQTITNKRDGSQTTSLMPRSNTSLTRELSEAQQIYFETQPVA